MSDIEVPTMARDRQVNVLLSPDDWAVVAEIAQTTGAGMATVTRRFVALGIRADPDVSDALLEPSMRLRELRRRAEELMTDLGQLATDLDRMLVEQ